MNPRLFPALFALCLWPSLAVATEAAWSRLRDGGYTVLIAASRPASSPDESAGNCTGPQHLSDRGRQQAQRMGARLAARAVEISRVLSSERCDALETARFVFPRAKAEPAAPLNPPAAGAAAASNAAMVRDIAAFSGPGNQAVVTFPPNISALTGVTLREGEVLIVQPNADGTAVSVVGRIISD